MKSPTLADARKLNLLPSVTTILRVLDKPALNEWRVEQGVLAVLTTPRLPGETDDAFVHRVLHVEKVQDQESQKAMDRGTEVHAAMESYFLGQDVDPELRPWIEPACKAISERGTLVTAEKILVGKGYAGKTDLITENDQNWTIWDFKTTKKLPEKGSWNEHVLQLCGYAAAWHPIAIQHTPIKPIVTANCYISTVEPGKFIIHENDPDWQKAFNQGFQPLISVWQFLNGYQPQQ